VSEWALVSVGSADWLPSRVLPARSPWPSSTPLVRLGDVASVRSVAAPLSSPLPLVTPTSVDLSSGTISTKRVADDEGLVLGEDLRVYDVLVPSHGPGPCVLVSDEARGLAFRGFHVVRPFQARANPIWLWATLSSASGIASREALSAGSTVSTVTASSLADLRVPLPTLEHADQPTFGALVPRPLVVEAAGEELRSAWSLRDLRRSDAWTGGGAGDREVAGPPLSELGTFWSDGVDKSEWFAVPAPGRLPVLTHRAVRGHREPFRPWATGGRATTDGTVVFTRTEPFRAKQAPAGMLLSKELVALDIDIRRELLGSAPPHLRQLSRAGLASVLVDYFSSARGKDVLASVARGIVIRHLSLAALRAVRVPRGLRATAPEDTLSLPDRLEAALRRALAS
jgi:hypothetical protein